MGKRTQHSVQQVTVKMGEGVVSYAGFAVNFVSRLSILAGLFINNTRQKGHSFEWPQTDDKLKANAFRKDPTE